MLEGAKTKNERKRLNQQAEKMRRELFEKQQEEADDPIYAIAEQITQSNNEQAKPAPPPPKPKPAAKPNKDKKRQKRPQKAQQRLALQSEIANAVNSTKTQSQAEYEQAELQLSKLHLKMHPVIGDGNCLYRSVAYCLSQCGLHEYSDSLSFKILRKKAADELRAHPNEYQSFAGCETSEEFEVYCNKVENTAEWGGELEVTALSNALDYAIVVHMVGKEPIKHGNQANAIQLMFLAHFTSSGGHYNAVVNE
ncbi:OTU domain-containing protein 6B [Histomonas meleagridis]|nr:OTU domain-containing protein 6B [Histomonas meleagridis]